MLDDYRLIRARRYRLCDLANIGSDVVRRPRTGVMHDVKDWRARVSGAVKKPPRLVDRFLNARELHDSPTIRVLAIDHDESRIPPGARLITETHQVAQGFQFVHAADLSSSRHAGQLHAANSRRRRSANLVRGARDKAEAAASFERETVDIPWYDVERERRVTWLRS